MKTALDISILTVNFAMMVAVGMGLESGHFARMVRRSCNARKVSWFRAME